MYLYGGLSAFIAPTLASTSQVDCLYLYFIFSFEAGVNKAPKTDDAKLPLTQIFILHRQFVMTHSITTLFRSNSSSLHSTFMVQNILLHFTSLQQGSVPIKTSSSSFKKWVQAHVMYKQCVKNKVGPAEACLPDRMWSSTDAAPCGLSSECMSNLRRCRSDVCYSGINVLMINVIICHRFISSQSLALILKLSLSMLTVCAVHVAEDVAEKKTAWEARCLEIFSMFSRQSLSYVRVVLYEHYLSSKHTIYLFRSL